MRMTIDIHDELLVLAERRAVLERRSLNELVEEGLRSVVTKPLSRGSPDFDLPVSTKRGGTLPGVDINNSAAVLDILDHQ